VALWSGGIGTEGTPLGVSAPSFAHETIALAPSLSNSLSALALWFGGRGLGTLRSACPLPRSRKQIVALARSLPNSLSAPSPLPPYTRSAIFLC
jgi:hypothetical protein